jgi:hypothetical protein
VSLVASCCEGRCIPPTLRRQYGPPLKISSIPCTPYGVPCCVAGVAHWLYGGHQYGEAVPHFSHACTQMHIRRSTTTYSVRSTPLLLLTGYGFYKPQPFLDLSAVLENHVASKSQMHDGMRIKYGGVLRTKALSVLRTVLHTPCSRKTYSFVALPLSLYNLPHGLGLLI